MPIHVLIPSMEPQGHGTNNHVFVQVVTDAMVYPPEKGSPSYELYRKVCVCVSE